MSKHSNYSVGQIVKHTLFDYRGVVIDVDPHFMLSDEWYELMAKSRPPKEAPWYHVLVHGAEHETYVAERNLITCDNNMPVDNPAVNSYFKEFEDGKYILDKGFTN